MQKESSVFDDKLFEFHWVNIINVFHCKLADSPLCSWQASVAGDLGDGICFFGWVYDIYKWIILCTQGSLAELKMKKSQTDLLLYHGYWQLFMFQGECKEVLLFVL